MNNLCAQSNEDRRKLLATLDNEIMCKFVNESYVARDGSYFSKSKMKRKCEGSNNRKARSKGDSKIIDKLNTAKKERNYWHNQQFINGKLTKSFLPQFAVANQMDYSPGLHRTDQISPEVEEDSTNVNKKMHLSYILN